MTINELPIPSFFDSERVGDVWQVSYQQRATDALKWRKKHHIRPSAQDAAKICLLLVDVQNTFCIPNFELYVAGRSGSAAVDDNQRLTMFIYRNLPLITQVCPTMDSHQMAQIFHSIFLTNAAGEHPDPYAIITLDDVEKGVWRFNRKFAEHLGFDASNGDDYLKHYARELEAGGKYALTIWPYHAMLGGIGHALVSAVEEAVFFHGVCRFSQPDFQLKGNHPLTENYSVLKPEITQGLEDKKIAAKNQYLVNKLLSFDALIIAGQAKSHCVASTVADLLTEIEQRDPLLSRKIYLLEDCTSPVVIPDVVDYTDLADAAFQRFSAAGMHCVRSTDPILSWPDFPDI